MAEVTYPDPFVQRVLSAEAPGGEPASVSVVAPTVVRPGEPFALRVAVADEDGYPSVACEGAVRIGGGFAQPGEVDVPFEPGKPAVARVEGVVIPTAGLFRFEVRLGGRAGGSNPVLCDESAEPIFWGDPHVHTVLSDCHPDRCRSLMFCFVAARHFAGLDWVCAADHVSNGRCELARWKEQAAQSNAFDDPPGFVTLPGYEASFKGGAGGDNNIYLRRWPELFVDDYEEGTVRTALETLAEKLPAGDFFAVPHHTTRTGKHGEIPEEIYPGPERMPVVEIHSKWGTSEYRGNPNPLHKIHPGPSYVTDLLRRGLRLGFVGGTDTHATMPAGFGREHLDRLPGMTAVRAGSLTRENVFDAIRTRRCYAASFERFYLAVTVGDVEPGGIEKWDDPKRPRAVQVTAAGRSEIERIDVIRNGETIHSVEPDGWKATFEFADDSGLTDSLLDSPHLGRFAFYYVRVTCASGAQAWSSPVWLTA